MTTVTDLDDNVSSDDDVEPAFLTMNVESVAYSILTGEWNTGDEDEMIEFVQTFRDFFTAVTTLRVKLDAQIWDGWQSGKVPRTVKSVRAQRKGAKPGRKATPKTLAEQLLKR